MPFTINTFKVVKKSQKNKKFLKKITAKDVLIAIIGVLITAYLVIKKVKGDIFIGIIVTWVLGMLCQAIGIYVPNPEVGAYSLFPSGIMSMDFSALGDTFGQCFKVDFSGVGIFNFIVIIFSFLFAYAMSLVDFVHSFSYDFNADALYQQYKDKYIQQGKMAMADTIGQASAMTGGYGNSYAATVGNQAYQASLQNLNDIIPELYQMAYDRYNQEGQDIRNNIAMLMADKDSYLKDWEIGYNTRKDAVDLANTNYYKNTDVYNSERDTKNSLEQLAWEITFTKKDDESQDALLKMQQEEHDAKMKAYNTPVVDETGGGGYKVTVDDSGNPVVVPTGGGSIPASIEKKASEFTSNTALASYLDGLVGNGLTQSQADQLYAQYADQNEKYVEKEDEKGNKSQSISYKEMANSTKGWKAIDNGGGNLFGIDADAIVEAPNGEQMSLKDLKKRLIAEGMTSSQATNRIKALQQGLGISSNWFFGL